MSESIQKWIGRNRPPRVQITYDVEIGDAQKKEELPFIVGILADASGDTERAQTLRERKFVEIDRDNFGEIMKKTVAPTLSLSGIPNELKALSGQGSDNLPVDLAFQSMDDFRPEGIVQQIPALRTLYDARRYLSDLLAYLDLREGLAEDLNDNILAAKTRPELKDTGARLFELEEGMAAFRDRLGVRAAQDVLDAAKSLPADKPWKDLKAAVDAAAPDFSILEAESFQAKVDLENWPPDLTALDAEVKKVQELPGKVQEAQKAAAAEVKAIDDKDKDAKQKAEATLAAFDDAVEPAVKTLEHAVAELNKHVPSP